MLNAQDYIARINELQDDCNMSDYELCKRTGLSTGWFSRMKKEQTKPKTATLERICDALNVTMSDFYNFNKKPKNGEYFSEEELTLITYFREMPREHARILIKYAETLSNIIGEEDNS